jgi:hypothetical protein
MRKKVVSDKDVEEDKVVDDAFEIVLERERRGGGLERGEFEVEVFTEQGEVHEEEVLRFEAGCGAEMSESACQLVAARRLAIAHANSPLDLALPWSKRNLLTKKTKVRIVAQEAEHDQVGVEAVQAVANVGVVSRLRLLEPNVLHDLVLAFSWDLFLRVCVRVGCL